MTYPTRIRYGLRLLAYLAVQEKGQRIPVSSVALGENVSVKYLEQIVGALRPLRALKSLRGAHGGYMLIKDPAEISIGDIFECLGGMAYPVPCLEAAEGCEQAQACTTRPFWKKFDAHMRSFLETMSLADLVAMAPPEAIERLLKGGEASGASKTSEVLAGALAGALDMADEASTGSMPVCPVAKLGDCNDADAGMRS